MSCSIQREGRQAFCELGTLKPADGAVTLTFTLTAKLAGHHTATARVAGLGDINEENDKDTTRITVLVSTVLLPELIAYYVAGLCA